MNNNLGGTDRNVWVCPRCQQTDRSACQCHSVEDVSRPELVADNDYGRGQPTNPEIRSTPDWQARPGPEPSVRPTLDSNQQVINPHHRGHSVIESDSRPIEIQPAAPHQPTNIQPLTTPIQTPQTPLTTPKKTQVNSNSKPKWGWILILGPLVIALGIIAWFQFRVLPPVDDNPLPPAVEFPSEGVASQPNTPTPTTEPNPAPQPAPVNQPETPNPPETPPVTPPPDLPPEIPSNPPPDITPQPSEPNPPELVEPPETSPDLPVTEIDPNLFLQFETLSFINLFDNAVHLSNLVRPDERPTIGNNDIDARLKSLASQAGYFPQPMVADSSQLVGIHQLQPVVDQQLAQLQQAASSAGHSLAVTTGYLSAEDQARIFFQKLNGDFSDQSLAATATEIVIPGYSRHQTGFAIDVVDGSAPGVAFVSTQTYDWLAANNFAAAKQFGFIPSFGGGGQHGQSEHRLSFELVYVGRERLLVN